MKYYIKATALCAAIASLLCCTAATGASAESGSNSVNITIDISKDRKSISPYIYGVNSELMNKDVSATAIRAGGNRFSAYNWETNASNAGSDWRHNSDNYFQQSLPKELQDTPGGVANNLLDKCKEKNDAYSLMTLQMAGYVAADMKGEVTKSEAAPSARWNKVEFSKGSDFTLSPDLNDGTVYMDEFVNYLVDTCGASDSGGIRGYSLDNEPSLWRWTHERVHPEKTGCQEIVDKSVEMSKAVKAIDPNAEIFGPALFGYGAFTNFADAPDWKEFKAENPDYRWFIDYYLDKMNQAEKENGQRLLDVLDIHYYTEAKGECGERSCNHYNQEGCVEARLNSTRSLWEEGYEEDSWIVDTGAEFFPLLPNIRQSIDTYYPGTKLAITEYDFGGSYDICGGIAEADALGLFAKYDVYLATLFAGEADYQCAAIDLYTNYDGNGSGFGDTLVSCESDNIDLSTAYAAVNDGNDDLITLVVSNKAFKDKTKANISISGGEYSYVHLYGLNNFAPQVFDMTDSNKAVTISGDTITYDMEPETVSLLVIGKDKETVDSFQNGSQSEQQADADSKTDVVNYSENTSKAGLFAIIGGGIAAVCAAIAAVIIHKKKKA